jgi:hypothetical protein
MAINEFRFLGRCVDRAGGLIRLRRMPAFDPLEKFSLRGTVAQSSWSANDPLRTLEQRAALLTKSSPAAHDIGPLMLEFSGRRDRGRAMDRRGCGLGFAAALGMLFAAGVWLNFALAFERERSVSSGGEWIATAFIDGTPLTAENERVHIWRWWQPRFSWLGCQVLEAKNESPTKLKWKALHLRVQHGFRPHELISTREHCGPVRISFERRFRPYS